MAVKDSKSKNTQMFYKRTSKLLMNVQAVQNILQNKTFESFIEELQKIE